MMCGALVAGTPCPVKNLGGVAVQVADDGVELGESKAEA